MHGDEHGHAHYVIHIIARKSVFVANRHNVPACNPRRATAQADVSYMKHL